MIFILAGVAGLWSVWALCLAVRDHITGVPATFRRGILESHQEFRARMLNAELEACRTVAWFADVEALTGEAER